MKTTLAMTLSSILTLLFLANVVPGKMHSPCFVDIPSFNYNGVTFGQPQAFYHSPLFMSPIRTRIKSKLQKLKQKQSHSTPSHLISGEVAGMSNGIGLWKEFRGRFRERRRRHLQQAVEDTKLSFLLKSEGSRRKKIKDRLKKLGYTFLSKKNGQIELKSTSASQSGDEEDEYNDFSLDGLRATSGVLRTRIRVKQDELKELEVLMRDVVREMRMEGFLNKKPQESEVEVIKSNSLSRPLGTEDMISESELDALNSQWKTQGYAADPIKDANDELKDDESEGDDLLYEFQLDLMKTRSAEIQSQILLDRIKLQRLERRIMCCESTELGLLERAVGNTLDTLNESEFLANPITVMKQRARRFVTTFGESSSVLFRRIDRESYTTDANERNLESLSDFVVKETSAGIRIVRNLLSNPSQLTQLIDPETPTLIPHVPAILSRLDRLESHVAPILSRVLNNKQHLRTIEPYLPEILERFDDIEPHLPWILDNIDVLAPYTGLLLKHIDELLLYAAVDEYETGDDNKDNYAFAEQLLPYLEVYVSQLDLVGPHLPLLRPHLPLLLKHNRIKILSPHVGKLFAKGYQDLSGESIRYVSVTFITCSNMLTMFWNSVAFIL